MCIRDSFCIHLNETIANAETCNGDLPPYGSPGCLCADTRARQSAGDKPAGSEMCIRASNYLPAMQKDQSHNGKRAENKSQCDKENVIVHRYFFFLVQRM